MAVFNVVQRRRRAATSDRKRRIHGDAGSGKLHQKVQPVSISGKRKRKILKKWRRDQKEAVEKGLITMEDVEMMAADGSTSKEASKSPVKYSMKKGAKLRLKQSRKKGKKKGKSQKAGGEASVDSMVE